MKPILKKSRAFAFYEAAVDIFQTRGRHWYVQGELCILISHDCHTNFIGNISIIMRLLVLVTVTLQICTVALVHALPSPFQIQKSNSTSVGPHSIDSGGGQKTTRLHFQHFSVEDGLSHGTIRAILQDHNGFMWFGTYDGLNRFDGMKFTIYRHRAEDSTSLSDNRITCLYEDSEHILWVGTEGGGLCRFDPATDSFTQIRRETDGSESATNYLVRSIFESRSGGELMLWVGVPYLSILDKAQQVLRKVQLNDPGFQNRACGDVMTIAKDHDGLLLVGSHYGCFRFDPITRTFDHTVSISCEPSFVVVPRENETKFFWIGTLRELMKIDRQSWRVVQRWPIYATIMCEDHRGRLWIGTNKGLLRMTGEPGNEQPTMVAEYAPGSESGLNDNNILNLYEDASGSLWIGTFNGLNRFDETEAAFTVYHHHPDNTNSLGDDFVLPIAEDGDGNIWFGTFGHGVSVLHQQGERSETFTHMKHDSLTDLGLCSNNVRSMLYDRTGTMWIGTGGGLTAYDTRTRSFKCYPTTPFRQSRFWTEALCEARDGTIWAAVGGGGLTKIERTGNMKSTSPAMKKEQGEHSLTVGGIRFTSYDLSKFSREEARVIVEDRHGTLWIGMDNGLVAFNPATGKFTRYVHTAEDSTSLSNNTIWSIYDDPNDSIDALWVGTNEGLNRFDIRTGKCVRYFAQEGFPSSCVYGILQDDWKRLWLSTNHGLTYFDDRQPKEMKFENYDVTDGVQGNEFNRRSFCRLRNGGFLFGGTHGVTRFNPLHIQRNPYVPPVALTSFTMFDKKVAFDRGIADVSSIHLNYDETVFAFEFVALNYTNSSKNQYAYMMEGFDKTWVHSGSRQYASYTHLDPGTYVFRVKASNNDRVWNEQGLAVSVMIDPPFWGTWWFRVLSSATLVAGLFMFYRRRVQGLEKEKRTQQEFSMRLMESQENERKRIAGELHDSLGQDLLVVRNRALLGLKDDALSAHVRDQLDQITSVATQAISNVREISHDLRPYQLDRLGLTKAITSLASTVADSSSIRFSMDVDPVDDKVGKEQAIHVYRIVQEGINNILKHSGASEARVEVRAAGTNISIIISDNGKGTPAEPSGDAKGRRGFGLTGITERAKAMNGTVTIESTPGKGTTLTVVIPGKRKTT